MLTLFVRSVILFLFAVLSMRVMGKRQIGQLQPFELVVVIMIAELAATPMGSLGTPLLYGILPMVALTVCHGLISVLCLRSKAFRRWVCGEPTVLIRNGVICEKQLRRMSVSLNDLMEFLRLGGAQDPSEVGTAVLETGGSVTVFLKADSRALTPKDMHLTPGHEGLPLPLILDGEIQQTNLNRSGLDVSWLEKQLRDLNYAGPHDVFFMCLNTQGLLMTQGKGREQMQLKQALEPGKVRW